MRRFGSIRNQVILAGCLLCLGLVLGRGLAEDEEEKPEFVGSKKCKMCHSKVKLGGAEYLKWEKGPHAKAYEALQTEESKELGKSVGVDDPATSEKCLKCHVTTLEPGTEKEREEGVGCEWCHGPGSIYKKKSIMEDYEASVAAGMRPIKAESPEETKKNIEALCRECHGLEHKDESPTAKEFDFDEHWAKVKHDAETLKEEFPEAFE